METDLTGPFQRRLEEDDFTFSERYAQAAGAPDRPPYLYDVHEPDSSTPRRRPQGKVIVPPRVERSAVDLQDLLGFAAAARQIVPSVLCVVVATVISLDGLFWFRCLPRAVYLLGLHPAYDEIVRARNEDFRNA